MAKIQMQWFWNFHLEEPESNKWDEVERRRTLFKRERSKSVVFTAKEPEKISNDYCADVDGDNDGDVYGEDDVVDMMARMARMTKNLLISRPEISSSSLGARQKMMERRRKVKVRFTF